MGRPEKHGPERKKAGRGEVEPACGQRVPITSGSLVEPQRTL
jgi:hypothetical protein